MLFALLWTKLTAGLYSLLCDASSQPGEAVTIQDGSVSPEDTRAGYICH
jgi:hypothetical protein